MLKTSLRRNALLALLLLVPAPSIAVATELYVLPEPFGQIVALVSKIWLFFVFVSVVCFIWVDKSDFEFQAPKQRELVAGVVLGLLMFSIIFIFYWLLGTQWIDVAHVRDKARQVRASSLIIYFASGVYWVFINSWLEEFVWRWFVYRKCEILVPRPLSIVLSAVFFTLHHIVGLSAYFDWRATTLGSLGVFLAGVVWSWCYLTYRSIWPGYISHLFADLAIFIIGWQLIFR